MPFFSSVCVRNVLFVIFPVRNLYCQFQQSFFFSLMKNLQMERISFYCNRLNLLARPPSVSETSNEIGLSFTQYQAKFTSSIALKLVRGTVFTSYLPVRPWHWSLSYHERGRDVCHLCRRSPSPEHFGNHWPCHPGQCKKRMTFDKVLSYFLTVLESWFSFSLSELSRDFPLK